MSIAASTAGQWLTARQVAEDYQMKPRTVYHYAHHMGLPHARLGRRMMFLREDVEGWIRENRLAA